MDCAKYEQCFYCNFTITLHTFPDCPLIAAVMMSHLLNRLEVKAVAACS